MTEYTDNRDRTPLAGYEPTLPDPWSDPEPQAKGGWIVGVAVVIVLIGMAFTGAVS